MGNGYPSNWDSLRQDIYKRDGYSCQNCRQKGGPHGTVELNAHHIVPKSKGGVHAKSNLITVCRPCHDAIHHNRQAPTQSQQYQNPVLKMMENGDKELAEKLLGKFGRTCLEASDFAKNIDKNVAIRSDGTLKNKELENKRIDLIQQLGSLTLYLERFNGEYKVTNDIETFIKSCVSFLTTIEDIGEIISDESISYSKKQEIIDRKFDRAIQQAMQDARQTNKSLDEFNRQIDEATKAVEAEHKSSSFLSRLFNF